MKELCLYDYLFISLTRQGKVMSNHNNTTAHAHNRMDVLLLLLLLLRRCFSLCARVCVCVVPLIQLLFSLIILLRHIKRINN